MKLSHAILVALSAAILSSCNKGDEPTPKDPVENPGSNGGNSNQPDYCPACGMG